MRKIIGAINMTLDGYCDHTAISADEELHDHYTNLLRNAGILLYGRITYQLMEFWRPFIKNPSGNRSMDEFAAIMDGTPKLVFSHTLTHIDWESARLASRDLKDEVLKLKQQPGNDIFAGSRSIIVQLINLNLIDELQLCVHPVIAGSGLALFEEITSPTSLKLMRTKVFSSGAITLNYEAIK